MVLWPDLEPALLGVVETPGQPARAVYRHDSILKILMERDGMTLGEAQEFLDFNIAGAYHGPSTPAILYTKPPKMQASDFLGRWADDPSSGLPMSRPPKKETNPAFLLCARCGKPQHSHSKKGLHCPLGSHTVDGCEMFHPHQTFKDEAICP